MRNIVDGLILIIVLTSSAYNYWTWQTTGQDAWRVSFISVALCLFIYALSRVRISNWPSIALASVFAIELIGVCLGWNLATRAFPEVVIIISFVGLAFWLSKLPGSGDSNK